MAFGDTGLRRLRPHRHETYCCCFCLHFRKWCSSFTEEGHVARQFPIFVREAQQKWHMLCGSFPAIV